MGDEVTPPFLASSPTGSQVYQRSWESFRGTLWECELYTDTSDKRGGKECVCVCV